MSETYDHNEFDAQELTQDDLLKTQAYVADAALKSPRCWDILRELNVLVSEKFMSTQAFTLPILNQMPVLEEKLNDPEAFKSSFATLQRDLLDFQQQVMTLAAKHQGRSGDPTPADWPVIHSISMDYSNLITHFETVISPLIFSLLETVQAEHNEMVDYSQTQGA